MKRGTPRHPKVYDLMQSLDLPLRQRPVVIGYLELLWHFTSEFAPQGDIGRYSDSRIEGAMDWSGKRGKLIEALTKSKWCDVSSLYRLVVHHWHDHADDATKKKLIRAGLSFVSLTDKVTDGIVPPVRTAADDGRLPEPCPAKPCPAAATDPPPQPTIAPVDLNDEPDFSGMAGAIRGLFPDTDDAMLRAIVHKSVQMVMSAGKEPRLVTDAALTEAVRICTKKTQHSAALYLTTVPTCMRNWAMEGS